MSKKKYVIESAFENVSVQKIMQLGLDANGRIVHWTDSIANIEELNSDYINEHFSDLQDTAYQKGFEDGKNNVENGCEGCKHESRSGCEQPCCQCKRGCMDFYDPMPEDDRIEEGDEVRFLPNDRKGIVTACHVPDVYTENDKYAVFCGTTVEYVLRQHITKTGKHYDIASILEAMRTHD